MWKSLLFSILFTLISISTLFAQEIQVDLDNPIFLEPEDIGHVCTLDPTEINAHFFISSEEIRGKLPSTEPTANFEIEYSSNCGGEQWPQEAQDALEYAGEIWGLHLDSPIPIRVQANWVEQDGNVLGSAGPNGFFSLTGAGIPNTVYSVAQASALIEQDIVAGEDNLDADMTININCNFDDWYFGTDANTPTGLIDFVTVALHEFGHGLGFLGTIQANNTTQRAGSGFSIPYIYEVFAMDGFFDELIEEEIFPEESQAFYDLVTGRNDGLFFNGREAELANNQENRVPLFAPSEFQPGSSFSHVDQQTFTKTENALMRPSVDRAFAVHNPGPVMCGMFKDMEWPLGPACTEQLADPDRLRKPLLGVPFNNAANQLRELLFVWESVNNASQYRFQLAADFNFTEILKDETTADTTFTESDVLETNNTYFWRVQGLTSQQAGAWSNTWSFSTVADAPGPVTLRTPDNEAENLRPGFELRWDAAERANNYDLQISEDPDFTDPRIDRRTSSTTFSATQDFPFSTTFSWRVRGVNDGGEGEWSPIRTFTTIIQRPEQVVLSTPSQDEGQVSTTPQFTWNESARASDYVIQVSLKDDFSDLVFEATTEGTSVIPDMPLENATIYFWRTRATNINGDGDWSNTRTFTTEVRETLVDANYPNPFNTETTFRYQLASQEQVLLDVYDITGRRVTTLVNEEQQAGVYFVPMNASGLASGTYLVRFVAGDVNDVQKMMLVK